MPGEVPFVGRDAELTALRGHAAAAAAGAARLVLVTGEAGAGKSALVAELATGLATGVAPEVDAGFDAEAAAGSDGGAPFAVGIGGSVDIPGLAQAQLPFGPFLEALRRVDGGALAGEWLATPAGTADAGHARFDAALRVVAAAAADRPLLLVLEDLQWADRSSLALLVHLARNLTAERVLLAATLRTGGADATVDHLSRLPLTHVVDVGPLPDDAVRRLVRAVVGTGVAADGTDAAAGDAVVEAVVARAEGNPLVAVELAGHRARAGVPPTLAASVRDRVRRSPAEVRAVLAAAAALGRRADHGLLVALLAATAPVTDDDARVAAVHAATDTGILRADGDGYRFRHGLDRDVVYDDLLPGERRALHAAAADALAAERRGAGVPAQALAEVAEHRLRSGDHAAAFHACLAAGRAAAAIDAYAEASAQLDRAVDLWTPGGASLSDLLLEAAEAARLCARADRTSELLTAATRRAETPDERARAFERTAWFRRRLEGHLDLAARAVAELGDDRSSAMAATTLATYATALMLARDYPAAHRTAREAVEVAERSGAEDARLTALTTVAVVVGWLGDVEESFRLLLAAERAAEVAGLTEQYWRARGNRLAALAIGGRHREIAAEAPEVLALAADSRRTPVAGLALFHVALAFLELGRWPEATDVATRMLAVEVSPWLRSELWHLLATIELRRGRPDAAAEHVRAAAGILTPDDDPSTRATESGTAAELAGARGDLAGARTLWDRTLRYATRAEADTGLFALTGALRLEADAATGPGDRLPQRLAWLCGISPLVLDADWPPRTAAGVDVLTCRAEVARARAALGEAATGERQAWRAAADAAGRDGRPYQEAYARLQLARALLAHGRRAPAAAALARAHAVASGLGAAALATAAEGLGRRARLPLTGVSATGVPERAAAAGLTAREVDVLELLVTGETNRRIARTLGISERTASVHVSHILAKLGVRSRTEAAAAAGRRQLLQP